eukprot:GHRR01024050.1.p1 GENE.GHRR01024050.1~~GHRR01024050.1.p1  ORF type:complete len:253 (+),score=49.10 GHRR01024050.1:767-1525(+)
MSVVVRLRTARPRNGQHKQTAQPHYGSNSTQTAGCGLKTPGRPDGELMLSESLCRTLQPSRVHAIRSIWHKWPALQLPPTRLRSTRACCASQIRQQAYILRPVEEADVAKLAEVEQFCSEFSANWSAASIQEELSKDIALMLVAADTRTNQAAGYIVGWIIADELQVLELAVHPLHQSKGIGTALLTSLMEQSRCDQAILEVKAHNVRAIQLYKRLGFVKVGVRRKYYEDGSDASLMAKALVNIPAGGDGAT